MKTINNPPVDPSPRPVAVLLLSIMLLFACPPVAGAGEEVRIDGVLHVRNSATPSRGLETIELEEAWRIGGDDEESVLLGLISEVTSDDEGNIYVMDAQLCVTHVYSPAGEHLRTLFGQGEGPGEALNPRDLVITGDGVGVVEEFPGKVIMVDRSGLPLNYIRMGGVGANNAMISLTAADWGGGNLVISGTESRNGDDPGISERRNFLTAFSPSGEELVCYAEAHSRYNFRDFTFSEMEHTPAFWWGFAVGSDGRVFVAPDRDEYAITVFNADGSVDRIIEREYDPLPRSRRGKQRIRDLFLSAMDTMPMEVKTVVEETEPVVDYFHRGLRVAADGSLWVSTGRGLHNDEPGVMVTYDVFDRKGHFTHQVAVVCAGDSYFDSLVLVSDNQIVLLKDAMAALAAQFGSGTTLDSDDDEATPQEIICYNIRKSH
ncbi:MAG: hypothetical protein GY835_15765 [bacterium]|nr:hypothetical protein [bacterium]